MESETEAFTVRRGCSLEDIRWVCKVARDEGWMPRETDAICFFTANLTHCFYIGELNGQKISCISIVKHGESCAVVGYYIVIKAFRGKGYGLKTWRFAFEDAGITNSSYNVQLYAMMNMQSRYEKWGLKPDWMVKTFTFDVSQAQKSLSDCQLPLAVAKIIPGSQVNLEKLVEYGADVMGSSQVCKSMLAAWISIGEESSWVATDNSSEIVGYLIMKKATFFHEKGYWIGPFYSDSAAIARSLLKCAVEFVADVSNLYIDVPCDNLEGVNIMEGFGAIVKFEAIFMASKRIKMPYNKVFGVASDDIMV